MVTGNALPMDRREHLGIVGIVCVISGVHGLILGALAGFASRFPEYGISFLRCCILIAIPVVIVRVLTAPHPKFHTADISYLACFFTAVATTAILVCWGLKRGRAVTGRQSLTSR